MPHTIEVQLYTFSELSETAQQRAIEDYRNNRQFSPDDLEHVIDDAVTIGKILGVTIRERQWTNSYGYKGSTPAVYYDLDRGCYASFDGEYAYAKGASKAIREHAPQDSKLHGIADGLQAIQRRYFYSLSASIRTACRETDISVSVSDMNTDSVKGETEETVTELLRDFAGWIHTQLVHEYEYQDTDEYIKEEFEANEWDFRENGESYT